MASKLWDSQTHNYMNRFHETMMSLSVTSAVAIAKSYGISEDELKSGMLENSKQFKDFCRKHASTLVPGGSCVVYAAVVAWVAKELGAVYQAFAGYCLKTSSPRYAKDKETWEAKKAEGIDHPLFPTHVYVVLDNGKTYECWGGDFDGIDHIDAVEIGRG